MICRGPKERWGTPCYPPNQQGRCNADMKKLSCGAAVAAAPAPDACRACTEFRNGAKRGDAVVCRGRKESWGTPCYPPNQQRCNPDMKKLSCGGAAAAVGSHVAVLGKRQPNRAPDCAAEGSTRAVRCCNAAGQGESDKGFPCSKDKTWAEAKAICESSKSGYTRLCTQEEVERGAGVGTGCGLDAAVVWTATPC